jgi:threonine/homoserine/homoserine lactone efflux protein
MTLTLWLSLAAICLMGAMSPGPSLAVVVKNTLSANLAVGLTTAISHGLGVTLYALFTVMGIGLIIVQSPLIFSFIQYAGALFLVYLAIKALMSQGNEITIERCKNNQVNGWRDGFLVAFLNPKLAIFFTALFSQFITTDATLAQQVIMVATVGIIDTLWYCIVALLISRGPILEKLKKHSRWVDRITGSFLLLLAARVILYS